MPATMNVGDIQKSLKTQVDASQKIYQTVMDLADIAHALQSELDDKSKQKLKQLMRDLVNVGDSLSENVGEMTKLVQKFLEPST